jgi:hypothetical protein
MLTEETGRSSLFDSNYFAKAMYCSHLYYILLIVDFLTSAVK